MPRTGLTAEEIRERAIDAAIDKMREVGFEKIRLTDIAKQLKVSHAALYSHFKDKSALLDAVSERWLLQLDARLDVLCARRKDPCKKIHEWALEIHRAKIEKVRHDPELYKALIIAEELKPFVVRHLETLDRQLTGLLREAIAKKGLRNASAESMAKLIRESLTVFHHPRMVAQHIGEDREHLLRQILDIVLKGLNLKK